MLAYVPVPVQEPVAVLYKLCSWCSGLLLIGKVLQYKRLLMLI